MNCYKGKCKYNNDNICEIDNKPCNMTKEPLGTTGMMEYHCRQERNEDLYKYSFDTAFVANAPRMPFWSCENICKYYDNCTE